MIGKLNNIYQKLNGRQTQILGSEYFSKYAVLLPIIEKNHEPHILFEVRSYQLRRQPGEICFPGGRKDSDDKDEMCTAVRETVEELGVEKHKITNIVPLDYLVTPFGTIIYPYVGTLSEHIELKPNFDEVEEVFSVPLSFFEKVTPEVYQVNCKMEPEENFPFEHIIGGEDYQWQTRSIKEYFYYYEDKVIWGLTARILNHFLEVLKE